MPTAAPAYTWNPRARQYIAPSGRFVPRSAVRQALDDAIDNGRAEIDRLAASLQAGEITIADWFGQTAAQLKRAHVAAGALAVGGVHALDASTAGTIGAALRFQYAKLYEFSRELEAGLPLDGAFLARASMYGDSARSTYEAVARKADIKAGYRWEIRLLGGPIDAACDQCKAEAAKRWQPIGTLKAHGACTCLTRCRCTWLRSKSRTRPKGDAVAGFARSAPSSKSSAGGKPSADKPTSGSPAKLQGGRWVTIRGRPIYIRSGQVLAGGVPGVTHANDGKLLARHAVDHDAMAAKITAAAQEVRRKHGYDRDPDFRYEHGPAISSADRKHLAKATAEGRVAVVITDHYTHRTADNAGAGAHVTDRDSFNRPVRRPRADAKYLAEITHPDATHHLVGGRVRASLLPPEGGKQSVVDHDEGRIYRHKTEAGARKHFDGLARRDVRDSTDVRRVSIDDPTAMDFAGRGDVGINRTVVFRVIEPPTEGGSQGEGGRSGGRDRDRKGSKSAGFAGMGVGMGATDEARGFAAAMRMFAAMFGGRDGGDGELDDDAEPAEVDEVIPEEDDDAGDGGADSTGEGRGQHGVDDDWSDVEVDVVEGQGVAAMSGTPTNTTDPHAPAYFSTTIPTTHRRTEAGYNVYPDAILFEVGDYGDKGFTMSEAEAAAAVAGFVGPVGGNIEHTNFMRGRACQVRSLRIDPDDPRLIRGEVAVPATFDAELTDEERRLSCEWDRETKRLTGLALTVNPRVKKAALVAAFAAHEATAEDVVAFAGEPDADLDIIAAFATPRKRDPELTAQMQVIHDFLAVKHPWACGAGAGSGKSAAFGDKPKQFKAVQKLHDEITDHGATCSGKGKSKSATFARRSPMSVTGKKRNMFARLLGLGDEHAAAFNEIVTEETADKWLSDLTANGAAATGDPAVTDAAAKISDGASRSDAGAAQGGKAQDAPVAFNFAESPEYLQMKADLDAANEKIRKAAEAEEARRQADIEREAVAFAKAVVFSGKAFPVEQDDLADSYREAAEADHATGGVVTFSDAQGQSVQGSRVDKLRAKVDRRPKVAQDGPSGLSGQPLQPGESVLFSGGEKKDYLAEAKALNDAILNPAGGHAGTQAAQANAAK